MYYSLDWRIIFCINRSFTYVFIIQFIYFLIRTHNFEKRLQHIDISKSFSLYDILGRFLFLSLHVSSFEIGTVYSNLIFFLSTFDWNLMLLILYSVENGVFNWNVQFLILYIVGTRASDLIFLHLISGNWILRFIV